MSTVDDKAHDEGTLLYVDKYGPVSYTHLDVYKRQGVIPVNGNIAK